MKIVSFCAESIIFRQRASGCRESDIEMRSAPPIPILQSHAVKNADCYTFQKLPIARKVNERAQFCGRTTNNPSGFVRFLRCKEKLYKFRDGEYNIYTDFSSPPSRRTTPDDAKYFPSTRIVARNLGHKNWMPKIVQQNY